MINITANLPLTRPTSCLTIHSYLVPVLGTFEGSLGPATPSEYALSLLRRYEYGRFWPQLRTPNNPLTLFLNHHIRPRSYFPHAIQHIILFCSLQDLPGTIRKVASFLGKNLTHEQIFKLVDYLDFDSFKKNPTVNGQDLKECGVITSSTFIRKGQTGGWIDTFTPELAKEADEWIATNLKDTDLSFPILNNNTS